MILVWFWPAAHAPKKNKLTFTMVRQPKGRGANSNASMRALSALKSNLHGHANNLRSQDPPRINRRPYQTLVVQQTLVGAGAAIAVQVSGVVKALLGQLGLAVQDATLINIKLQRCDCWAVSKADSSVRPALNTDFSSLIPAIGDPTTPGNAIVAYPKIKRLEDIGGVASAARVSYTWPLSMRDIPLTQQSDFVLIETSSNMTEIDIFWHVQWSPSDIASPV